MSLPVLHLEDYLLPDLQTVHEFFADESEASEILRAATEQSNQGVIYDIY